MNKQDDYNVNNVTPWELAEAIAALVDSSERPSEVVMGLSRFFEDSESLDYRKNRLLTKVSQSLKALAEDLDIAHL